MARSYEGRAFVAAIAVVVTALSLASTVRYVDLWQSRNDAPTYFRNARATLADAPEHPVPLVDRGIPQSLLWSFRFPENSYSHLLRPYADQTSYPRATLDELYVLDDEGRLAPVAIDPARSMKKRSGCGYRLRGETTTVPLDGPVLGGGWWIRMSYEASRPVPLRLRAGEEVHDLELPAGEHDVYVQAAGEFDEVELSDHPAGSGLCVTDLVLGAPAPGPSS